MNTRPDVSQRHARPLPAERERMDFSAGLKGEGGPNLGAGYTKRVIRSSDSADTYNNYLNSLQNQQDSISHFMNLTGSQQGIVFNDFRREQNQKVPAYLTDAEAAFFASFDGLSVPDEQTTVIAGMQSLGPILWGTDTYKKKWYPRWIQLSSSQQYTLMSTYITGGQKKSDVEAYLLANSSCKENSSKNKSQCVPPDNWEEDLAIVLGGFAVAAFLFYGAYRAI